MRGWHLVRAGWAGRAVWTGLATSLLLVACASPPGGPRSLEVTDATAVSAGELAAFVKAKPVFEAYCIRCHASFGEMPKPRAMKHLDMSGYPFGGQPDDKLTEAIRKALGAAGTKATMPPMKPGAVQGAELQLILDWAQARDAARSTADPTSRRDDAPHTVRSVAVGDDITLEVLDFGGRGEALVLLAGLGNSAHVFDDFAPHLVGKHHVYAITRRGFGASSAPATGYDVATRAHDDIAVLDALSVERAALVGHSMAGDELTAIAGRVPTRVSALVYLDAAFDQLAVEPVLAQMPPLPEVAAPSSFASPLEASTHLNKMAGVAFPMGEVLATYTFAADGHSTGERARADAGEKILSGTVHPDYPRVECPALSLSPRPAPPEVELGELWTGLNGEQRAAWNAFFPKWLAHGEAQKAQLRAQLNGVRIVEVPSVKHYFFLDAPRDVARDIEAFLDEAETATGTTGPLHVVR